jgi:hypothetical protein
VLERIFVPKKDEVTGHWRKLHNQELYNSPNVSRIIKSMRMGFYGHAGRMQR